MGGNRSFSHNGGGNRSFNHNGGGNSTFNGSFGGSQDGGNQSNIGGNIGGNQSNIGGGGSSGNAGRGRGSRAARRGRTATGQIICYSCGKIGHIAAKCHVAVANLIEVSHHDNVQQVEELDSMYVEFKSLSSSSDSGEEPAKPTCM